MRFALHSAPHAARGARSQATPSALPAARAAHPPPARLRHCRAAAAAADSPATPSERLRLLSGSAHEPLAREIAAYLGIPLTGVLSKRFADGEVYVQVLESVRGCDVFLVQPTCAPVADTLMELMLLVDACRRASAATITLVLPYFGYSRADRKSSAREAIAAKLVANLLTESGADRVLGLDLHSGQLEGYFDIPMVHVGAGTLLADYISHKIPAADLVVVSPDVGGVSRARRFAKTLSDAPLAIIDKRRTGHNQAQVMNLLGDVAGRDAVLIDDMIDTAGTICGAADLLLERGATRVFACATHPLFSGPAPERLRDSVIERVVVTNTLPIPEDRRCGDKLVVLSIAPIIASALRAVFEDESVSDIFQGENG